MLMNETLFIFNCPKIRTYEFYFQEYTLGVWTVPPDLPGINSKYKPEEPFNSVNNFPLVASKVHARIIQNGHTREKKTL